MKRLLIIIALFLAPIIFVLGLNFFIFVFTRPYVVALEDVQADRALVFGASVLRSGEPSDILADRLRVAEALYENEQVQKIVVSGDGVGDDGYDEVASMTAYLVELGVAEADIVAEPFGLDSFQSVVRFHEMYPDGSVVFVTQGYHLPRVLFIGRSLGVAAVGTPSDLQTYVEIEQFRLRELLANVKAAFEVVVFLIS
ncbi:YdcF family protein [Patescibacteria group bacterium]|nr:YdcF family protein [Patescibacteria group bacterium]